MNRFLHDSRTKPNASGRGRSGGRSGGGGGRGGRGRGDSRKRKTETSTHSNIKHSSIARKDAPKVTLSESREDSWFRAAWRKDGQAEKSMYALSYSSPLSIYS